MKTATMLHCKDIPDRPILEFLAQKPEKFHTWCDWEGMDVKVAMPEGVPHKLAWAKMNRLMKRKLVDGCDCGCRGDYVITRKGLAFVSEPTSSGRVS